MYLHRGANLTSFCTYIISFNDHWSQKMHTKAKILLTSKLILWTKIPNYICTYIEMYQSII